MSQSGNGEQVAQLGWKPSTRCACAVGLMASFIVLLAGCGGGDGPPDHEHVETTCSASQLRAHCSQCKCAASDGKCTGPGYCTACRTPYLYTPGESSTSDGNCTFECPSSPPPRPPMPTLATDLNGKAWPEACFNGTEEHHFFIIGDWGGIAQSTGPPKPFFDGGRNYVDPIDGEAQVLVAARMKEIAETSKPKFVINAGDNFYPGGIDGHCDAGSGTAAFKSYQFAQVFEAVYTGKDLETAEWWGVLGNHDYGGYCYMKAWDQNIFYTWHSADSRWLTPALWWSRRAQFRDFSVDFFFLDTNIDDVFNPHDDPGHNICAYDHTTSKTPCIGGGPVCNGTSMKDAFTCQSWFQDAWGQQQKWLEAKLKASDADWQIVVGHYPADAAPALDTLKTFAPQYGIDLIIGGHRHQQEVHYKNPGDPHYTDTAWIVSGGGGGIRSEGLPTKNGLDDQYGFFDVTISRDHIYIEGYSHGGVDGKRISRFQKKVLPVGKATSLTSVSGSAPSPAVAAGSAPSKKETETIV